MKTSETKGLILTILLLSAAGSLNAGNADSPAAPESPDSAMFTIQDIYNVLNTRTQASKRSGPFSPPSGGPTNATMHTLNDIMTLITNRAATGKTGQTTSFSGAINGDDDGVTQLGTAWPSPRFTDNGDDTITDNLTSLMWTKNANLPGGTLNWTNALEYITVHLNTLGGDHYAYGGYTDWRLPNIRELFSLIDNEYHNPPLPAGHPFDGVQNDNYWSSTTDSNNASQAFLLYMGYPRFFPYTKAHTVRVWPVRKGEP